MGPQHRHAMSKFKRDMESFEFLPDNREEATQAMLQEGEEEGHVQMLLQSIRLEEELGVCVCASTV